MIDDLPTILGALTGALQRGLAPDAVVAVPEVRDAICRHVRLRQGQELPASIVAREYLALVSEMFRVLEGECERRDLSGTTAFAVANRIISLVTTALAAALDECAATPAPA